MYKPNPNTRTSNIFQNFMLNHDRVVSIPIIINRSAYLEDQQEGIGLYTASKARMFIGFKKWKPNTHTTIQSFSPSESNRSQNTVKSNNNSSYQINFLSELPHNAIPYFEEIDILSLTIAKILDQEEELSKEKIEQYLPKHLKHKQKSIINLFTKDQISTGIIYQNHIESHYHQVQDLPQQQARQQILFTQKIQKKNQNIMPHVSPAYQDSFPIIKGIEKTIFQKLVPPQRPSFYDSKEKVDQQKENIHYFFSHSTLTARNLSQDKNNSHICLDLLSYQHIYQKGIPHLDIAFEYAIIPHSTNNNHQLYSLFLPQNISKIATDEVIQKLLQSKDIQLAMLQPQTFSTHPGLQEEQPTSTNMCSTQITHPKEILIDAQGNTIHWDIQTLYQTSWYHIILDKINNKIIINGAKLEAKQLHSQSMTIELLSQLYNKQEILLHNKSLAPSSYSKNKNNMSSKIILPLKKIIHKKLGKKLEINCHGWLHDFYIKYKNSNINIAILTHISSPHLQKVTT